jgi:hypothetical protein
VALHLVNYDLDKPGQSYQTLIKRLTEIGARRVLLSTWMVQGNYTAIDLRDDLRKYIDANDRLLIADTTNGQFAWHNLLTDIKTAFALTAV